MCLSKRLLFPLTLRSSAAVAREIYFARKPIDWAHRPEDALEHNSVYDGLSSTEAASIQEAIGDAKSRYARSHRVPGFDPAHRLVRVVDGPLSINDATDETPYSALFPIQAYPPGYSHGRKCAVVQVFIPEIMHPSYVTYVLIAENGNWTISHRGIVTYI